MANYTEEQNRIIRLAEKLYRLGNGTNSAAEAEAAILKAQQLLCGHNLTIKDLSFFEREAKCSQRGVVLAGGDFPGWARQLAAALADIYTCRGITGHSSNGDGRSKITFVGVEPNASIAERSFIIAYRHLMTKVFPPRTSQKQKTEFRMGFCDGLYLKMYDFKRANEEQTPGLVLATKAVVDKAFHEMYPEGRKGRRTNRTQMTDSYMRGMTEGKTFSVSAGVTAAKTNRQMAVSA